LIPVGAAFLPRLKSATMPYQSHPWPDIIATRMSLLPVVRGSHRRISIEFRTLSLEFRTGPQLPAHLSLCPQTGIIRGDAVRGNEVIGSGEPKEADIGLACGGNYAVILRYGKLVNMAKISVGPNALLGQIRTLV